MGPIWGRQDPGGPHVGPMNFAIWVHPEINGLSPMIYNSSVFAVLLYILHRHENIDEGLINVNLRGFAIWPVVYGTAVIKIEYDILWTPNPDPIPCPYGQTMVCLLGVLTEKADHDMRELDCIMYSANLGPTHCKDGLSRYWISIVKIRRSWDCFIFIMGISLLVIWYLYIEMAQGNPPQVSLKCHFHGYVGNHCREICSGWYCQTLSGNGPMWSCISLWSVWIMTWHVHWGYFVDAHYMIICLWLIIQWLLSVVIEFQIYNFF